MRCIVARVKSTEKETSRKTKLIIDELKTKASKRDIPIPSTLLPVIVEYRQTSISKFVVSDKEGFISPRTYEYRYHRILDFCGVNSINYHALRHMFVSRCIEVGVNAKSLSRFLDMETQQ